MSYSVESPSGSFVAAERTVTMRRTRRIPFAARQCWSCPALAVRLATGERRPNCRNCSASTNKLCALSDGITNVQELATATERCDQ